MILQAHVISFKLKWKAGYESHTVLSKQRRLEMFPLCHLSVDDLVPAERACLAETFPADLTHERPGARVHGHVARQIVMSIKHLQKETSK